MFFISTRSWSIKTGIRYSLILFTIATSITAKAQIIQKDRYEVPLAPGEAPFEVVSADESGLFLHRTILGIESNALNLVFLDTGFQAKWSGFLPIERNYVQSRSVFYDSSLYVLLRYKDFTRSDLQLVVINKTKGTYTTHPFKNFIPIQITQFKVTKLAAIIGGYFNRVPVVLYFSFKDNRSKIAPGLFNDVGELDQIRTYDDGSFDVLVVARNFLRQQTITIRNYDPEGSLTKTMSLRPEEKRNLIFGQSLKTNNDMQVVAGVYGNRNSEYSKGIFMASIDPVGNDILKYYSYADLENFFKYMKARREQRVKERIARRKIKGRKLRFNYRFVVHELVPYKDQYIMLGEAFYPKYIYPNGGGSRRSFFGPAYGINRGSSFMMQDGRVFDGYYYTHAVVIGFDSNGKLLWDNSFEINDVKTFELEQFVKLDVREDHITLLYFYDQKIRSKIINDNQVIEGKSIEPIQLKFETDRVKKTGTESTKLGYWYLHHFYATGIQTVSSNADGVNQLRRVFFINKLTHP